MTFNTDTIRSDFPILHQEHSPGVPLIYLDNGASSQHPQAVIESMRDYYARYHANVHRGIHKLSEEATTAYEQSRDKMQAFINAAGREEIIFTRGTTESINLVAQSWGRENLKPGDVVVSTQMEHHANIVPWQILSAQIGFELRFIPITAEGLLDLDVLQTWLNDDPVKLVSVVHMSNVLGTINPVEDIVKIAHAAGALVLVDGAQSVPHMPVDVQSLDVDFMAFSGHKMVGPTGVGILYGKRHLLDAMPPWIGGGDMIERVSFDGSTWNDLPYKFEAGTPSIAQSIGLGCAVDYLSVVGMDAVHQHEQTITQYAYEALSAIEGLTIYGPAADQRGGLVSFTLKGIHASDVAQMLDADGIAVRSGHHCAQPLHDLLGVGATTRASFYLYNTLAEVDKLAESIKKTQRIFGG
jgi:cysteine desulfurase / selenocysteine lyase